MTAARQRLAEIQTIGKEIAAAHAADVDAQARLPHETIQALKDSGALSSVVPRRYGGDGAGLRHVALQVQALAEHCASSGMLLAMHHIQIASIAPYVAGSEDWEDYLRQQVLEQRLIASATSEIGTSGDLRRSICAVEQDPAGLRVEKQASTISYGHAADDILLTARRSTEARPGDQIALLALRGGFELETQGSWDTLGMRGTCSPGGRVRVSAQPWQVLPASFGLIAREVMTPYSHVCWSACWLGVTTDAVRRARLSVREQARNRPGQTPAAAATLSRATKANHCLAAEVHEAAHAYDRQWRVDREAMSSLGYIIDSNNLKIAASEQAVQIVNDALLACGIPGYRDVGPLALGRHLRDAHAGALMVNNDRIRATNAQLLCFHDGGYEQRLCADPLAPRPEQPQSV